MIEIDTDFIFVNCSDQHAKKLDAQWIKSKKAYRLPNTLGALREMHHLGYDVAEYGKKKAELRERLLQRKEKEPLTDEVDLTKLRPYQKMDVNFLSSLPNCGIFSEMRTGKTPTTLKLLEAEGHKDIIIICPASLVLNWQKEVSTWTNLKAFAVSGTKTKRSKTYKEWAFQSGCLVLSKDTAKSDIDLLGKFTSDALVIDESHFLRNYKTLQSKAVFQLGKQAKKRIAITGTPSMNSGADAWGILHFLYPEKFPSYWQFVDRYFKTWNSPWGAKEIQGYKRKEELQEILDLISVQRKRSEVMQWIPPKQYQTIELEMNKKQRKAYDEMLNFFSVEDTDIDASGILAQLTRLRQICLAPELLDIEAPSEKEKFILEWLEDNPNEQVIIFSNFSSYLRDLRRKIPGAEIITGEQTKVQRQASVDMFQAGNCQVILANIQAAGVGLTLDKAGTVIFLDRAYTNALNEQAEDRIIATKETSNTDALIIDVVCKDSVDQKILDILKSKKSVTEVINNYKNVNQLLDNLPR